MQTTQSAVSSSARAGETAGQALRLAECHVLLPPYGDPGAAHELASSLRSLAGADPQAVPLDTAGPFDGGGALPLGLNLWPSPEALRDHVLRSGPALRRWRMEAPTHRPVPRRVLWWTTGRPDVSEGLMRLQMLRRHGPGPAVFTLRSPYPAPPR